MSKSSLPFVALISEFPPPSAGMTVLAEDFYLKIKTRNFPILKIRTNPRLGVFRWINKIRILRSIINWLIFLVNCFEIRKVNITHIFSSSGLNYVLFTIPALIISKIFSNKIIIHYHGGAAKVFFSKYIFLLNFSMKLCDQLVVPSGYLNNVFNEFGYQSSIISNPIDINKFVYRSRKNIEPNVVSIRNLTSVYNVQCAIRAFSIFKLKYTNAKLFIAGDGPEKANIINLIENLELKDVYLLGNVPNKEIPELINRADIFVNTSNVDNMPGSILEAFSSGIPVVSTNVGGIPFIVEHNKSGFLTEANDHVAMAKYMTVVVEEPERALKMTALAYETVKNLQWSVIEEKWLSLYTKLTQK